MRFKFITFLLALSAAVAGAGAWSVATAAASNPLVVTLTFDDGLISQYQVRNALQARGMKGTFYVNSGLVGSSPHVMTWNHIKQLAEAGHEIGGHGLEHRSLVGLDAAELRRQVCEDRANMVRQGLNPKTFAYPEGHHDATVHAALKSCGYVAARVAGGLKGGVVDTSCPRCSVAEMVPPFNELAIRVQSDGWGDDPLARLQALVLGAEETGDWLPLMFHDICSNCATKMTPAVFDAFLGWLQSRAGRGTVVKTMAEVMGANTAPAPPVVRIAKLTTTPPRAGQLFTVRAVATDGTGKQLERAQVRCSLTVAGRAMRTVVAPRYAQGIATCTWRLPLSARGKAVAGWIEPAAGTAKLRRTFRALAR